MKFETANFQNEGDHLRYLVNGESKFIARFKHRGPVKRTHLKKMLKKYYTVEDYLSRVKNEAPLSILERDGYLVFDHETRQFILDGKVM